ncbi:MAG: stage VI sporulation protein F, partial [Ruminococcus sp.]
MKLSDNLFKKIKNKTGIEKSTILDLAAKLQDGNMKNEEALRDVIQQI